MRVLWLRRVLQICFLITFIFVGAIFLVSIVFEHKNPNTLADVYPPFVELNGDEKITIALGEKYNDEGIDAFDIDGDIDIVTEGEVDTDTVGDYEIKYKVYDKAGNVTEKNRNVKVIKPSGIIYLTFDDGPGDYTSDLLDVLKKKTE